jgi:uncharacterized protein
MMQPAPVPASARIETLDVLRGFALLGILAMNIRAMAAPFGAYMYPYALFDYTGVNRAAFIFTSTAVDLKMMGLFSSCSGPACCCTRPSRPRTAGRRAGSGSGEMFWLLVIAEGDILVPYALEDVTHEPGASCRGRSVHSTATAPDARPPSMRRREAPCSS